MHRRAHGRPGRHVHPERRVLHARPPRALRRARRGADRQHLVRDHRLERADHGRRVPQPRRLDRARRPQRERRPADVRRRAGRRSRSTTRCRAARSRRSCGRPPLDDGYRLLDPPSGPTEAVDDDATTTWSGSDLNLDLGRTQRVRRVVVDAGTAAPPGPATLTIGGKTWTADGGGQLDDVRHPGDAGAVPAGRLRHARDGRGRAYLPLRRKHEKDPARWPRWCSPSWRRPLLRRLRTRTRACP